MRPRRLERCTLRSGSTGQRLMLALVSLGFAAQVASFAHLLLVPHALCREHGELVHADAGLRVVAHASANRSAVYETDASDAEGEHAHEHCASTVHQKHKLTLQAPVLYVMAPAELKLSRPVACAGARPAQPLLRLAPKNSPPA